MAAVKRGLTGRPRLRQPVRDQVELRAVDLDGLVGPPIRSGVIRAYVERLDPHRAYSAAQTARSHFQFENRQPINPAVAPLAVARSSGTPAG